MEIKRYTPMKIIEVDYTKRFSMALDTEPTSVVLVLDRKSLLRERGFYIHHRNVFILDQTHDWNFKRGKLSLYMPVDEGTKQLVGLAYGSKLEKADEFGALSDLLCSWSTIRSSGVDYSGLRLASDIMYTAKKLGVKSIKESFPLVVKHLLMWKCNADPKSAADKVKLLTKAKQIESVNLAGRDGIVVLLNTLACLYYKLNGRRFDIVDLQVGFDFEAKSYSINLKYTIGE